MIHVPKVGAFVLETLTTGMYTNPLDTIREFVQNAADSIRKAEENTLLAKGEGRIEIKIDPRARTLVVRDNGIGVNQANVANSLIDIGMSDKSIETDAGFRGIGRLAGIAYCENLGFRTSAYGEPAGTVITMDCSKLRQAISPVLRRVEELSYVMGENSRVEEESRKKEDHYFEVVMEGIGEGAGDFLDWQRLERYLCQVAPVEYDAQRFVYAPKIKDWIKKSDLSVFTATLVIKTPEIERQVFKPYKGHYKTRRGDFKIDIYDVLFYPEDFPSDTPFWMWYGKTDLLGMVEDERAAGLRFRKNNIALGGPERVAELFPGGEGRLNSWLVGEIHVLSHGIIPNARRDGFELTDDWENLKLEMGPFITEHCKLCHAASSSGSRPLVKVMAAAKSTISDAQKRIEVGLVSKQEHDDLLKKIRDEENRVSKVLERSPEEIKMISPVLDSLKEIRGSLESETHFGVKKVHSTLDRKQRKLLREVLEIIHSTLSETSCSKNDLCYKNISAAILDRFRKRV